MLLYIGLDTSKRTRPQEEENRMYTIDQMGYVNAHNAAISEEIRRARIGEPGQGIGPEPSVVFSGPLRTY
jgi:hypothetical protein